jgi:hypothetical protein
MRLIRFRASKGDVEGRAEPRESGFDFGCRFVRAGRRDGRDRGFFDPILDA